MLFVCQGAEDHLVILGLRLSSMGAQVVGQESFGTGDIEW